MFQTPLKRKERWLGSTMWRRKRRISGFVVTHVFLSIPFLFALWNCCSAHMCAYQCFLLAAPTHFGFSQKETTCMLYKSNALAIFHNRVHSFRQTVSEHNSSHCNSIVAYSILFHYCCISQYCRTLPFYPIHSNSTFNYLQYPTNLLLIVYLTTQGGVKSTTQSQE